MSKRHHPTSLNQKNNKKIKNLKNNISLINNHLLIQLPLNKNNKYIPPPIAPLLNNNILPLRIAPTLDPIQPIPDIIINNPNPPLEIVLDNDQQPPFIFPNYTLHPNFNTITNCEIHNFGLIN
jgi:hypothetical protein